MKRVGLSTTLLAFLAGAYLTVLHPTEVPWPWFIPVVVLGFGGVAAARMAARSRAGAVHVIEANVAQLEASLAAVVTEVQRLLADRDDVLVYGYPGRIDDRIVEHLNRFVDVRDTMKAAYGLRVFADVMGPYAGGERYLNRVWSAAADGYADEAHEYIGRAFEQFRIAREKLLAARG